MQAHVAGNCPIGRIVRAALRGMATAEALCALAQVLLAARGMVILRAAQVAEGQQWLILRHLL